MTLTYDPTTNLGKVRLLISDTDLGNAIFTDEEIAALTELVGDEPLLVAAMALDALAADAAKLAIKTKQDSISTDPSAVPGELRDQATRYREQWAANSSSSLTLIEPPDAVFVLPVDPETGTMDPW